jgi:hypothetical protein
MGAQVRSDRQIEANDRTSIKKVFPSKNKHRNVIADAVGRKVMSAGSKQELNSLETRCD